MHKIQLQEIFSGDVDCEVLREVIEERWGRGIVETTDLSSMPRKEQYEHIPWVKVDCMHTKLIGGAGGGIAFGLDLFAPRAEEKSYMHVHPRGDRIATVLEGEGVFFALRDGELIQQPLRAGNVVSFPRNTPHAFWGSDRESLLLHVVLNPLVPFDDPQHTVPSPEGAKVLRAKGLID